MKKLTVLLLLGLTANILLSQTTKEQADEIIISYLQNELIQPFSLYFNINTPTEAGIDMTTTKEEAVKIKYACWAYFVKESLRDGCRYLFVKQDNGNLLEIITYNDSGIEDLSSWELMTVRIDNNLEYNLFPYPNPATDWIIIPFLDSKMIVDIYDLSGNRILSKSISKGDDGRLNVSFLKSGIYVLNILSETKTFNFKIIKK